MRCNACSAAFNSRSVGSCLSLNDQYTIDFEILDTHLLLRDIDGRKSQAFQTAPRPDNRPIVKVPRTINLERASAKTFSGVCPAGRGMSETPNK